MGAGVKVVKGARLLLIARQVEDIRFEIKTYRLMFFLFIIKCSVDVCVFCIDFVFIGRFVNSVLLVTIGRTGRTQRGLAGGNVSFDVCVSGMKLCVRDTQGTRSKRPWVAIS